MNCRAAPPRQSAPTAAQSFKLIEAELADAIRRADEGASVSEIAGRLQIAQTIAIVAGAYANRREREAAGV